MTGYLYFVRHGESHANAGGISMPHDLIRLTEKGVWQARDVVAAFPPQSPCVLTSTLLRTQETAAPYCARYGVTARADARLDEVNILPYDMIAGMDGAARKPLAQAYWDKADPQHRMGTGADTFLEFAARVDDFIADMAALPDNTVIFGHGMWCAMMQWRLDGRAVTTAQDMRDWRVYQQSLPMDNGVIYRMSRGVREQAVSLYRAGPCMGAGLSHVL